MAKRSETKSMDAWIPLGPRPHRNQCQIRARLQLFEYSRRGHQWLSRHCIAQQIVRRRQRQGSSFHVPRLGGALVERSASPEELAEFQRGGLLSPKKRLRSELGGLAKPNQPWLAVPISERSHYGLPSRLIL